MDISIIIVNYGSGILVKSCVDSIRRTVTQLNYEIIVVDNASPDDSQELLATELPGIRFYPQTKNLGFAKGVNIGIKASKGRYILILNPDIIVLKNAIDKLIEFAEGGPEAAVVAGQLVNPSGSIQESCFRFYTPATIIARRTPVGFFPAATKHIDYALMREYDHATPRKVDWALGACLLVKREAIEKVGMMDPRFFLYFEDMDWCRRFWEEGYDVWYVPEARFAHYYKRESAVAGGLSALLKPITRIHIHSGFKYFWKYRKQGIVPSRRAP